tara:strand:- start:73 stop:375 length:303 start_codon:yes stop_codon:yes gene_type:complete
VEADMILRRLVFAALRTAASNPEVRKQASKLAQVGLQAAKPSLMQASQKVGQAVRSASGELSAGVRKFKAGRDGTDDIITSTDKSADAVPQLKNITPKKR